MKPERIPPVRSHRTSNVRRRVPTRDRSGQRGIHAIASTSTRANCDNRNGRGRGSYFSSSPGSNHNCTGERDYPEHQDDYPPYPAIDDGDYYRNYRSPVANYLIDENGNCTLEENHYMYKIAALIPYGLVPPELDPATYVRSHQYHLISTKDGQQIETVIRTYPIFYPDPEDPDPTKGFYVFDDIEFPRVTSKDILHAPIVFADQNVVLGAFSNLLYGIESTSDLYNINDRLNRKTHYRLVMPTAENVHGELNEAAGSWDPLIDNYLSDAKSGPQVSGDGTFSLNSESPIDYETVLSQRPYRVFSHPTGWASPGNGYRNRSDNEDSQNSFESFNSQEAGASANDHGALLSVSPPIESASLKNGYRDLGDSEDFEIVAESKILNNCFMGFQLPVSGAPANYHKPLLSASPSMESALPENGYRDSDFEIGSESQILNNCSMGFQFPVSHTPTNDHRALLSVSPLTESIAAPGDGYRDRSDSDEILKLTWKANIFESIKDFKL